MKKYILVLLVISSVSINAQSVIQGTISATGATFSSDSGVQINFTLGQPFGEGEMQEGEVTIVQGLQGASPNIEAGPAGGAGTIGINDFTELEADLFFEPNTGQLILSGSNVNAINGKVMVSNISGQVLLQSSIYEGEILGVKTLSSVPSMCIITILTDDNKRLSKKIIF